MIRPLCRVACWLVAFFLLTQFSQNAFAQALPNTWNFTQHGGKLTPGAITTLSNARTWAANGGGGVRVVDEMVGRVAANSPSMAYTRVIPWAGIATAAAKALPLIATGVALYAVWQDLRCYAGPVAGTAECDPGQPTQPVVTTYFQGTYQTGPTTCAGGSTGNYAQGWSSTLAGAAAQYAYCYGLPYASQARVYTPSNCTNYGSSWLCRFTWTGTYLGSPISGDAGYQGGSIVTGSVQGCPSGGSVGYDGKCPSAARVATSVDDLAEKFETHANPANAVQDAKDAMEHGVDLAPYAEPGVLTGPESLTGEPEVKTYTPPATQANPNPVPQTTTTTPHYQITYEGDTYNYTTTYTTVNPDGSTETRDEPTPEDVAPPSDTAMPGQPTLYERVYPDGIAGVWEDKQSAFSQTPAMQFLNGLVPSFGDGGCPAFSLPSGNLLGIQVGGQLDVPCTVFAFVRLCMIIGAVLLARALIFGG